MFQYNTFILMFKQINGTVVFFCYNTNVPMTSRDPYVFIMISLLFIPFSICMTTISTVLALGMMPLNLWIYGRSWSSSGAVVPFESIAISLAFIFFPVVIGILIQKWNSRFARMFTKVRKRLRLIIY